MNGCPPNLLSRQNQKQPERKILGNGENSEIRKIRQNQNNNAQNQNFPKIPPKEKKVRKIKRFENKIVQAKAR